MTMTKNLNDTQYLTQSTFSSNKRLEPTNMDDEIQHKDGMRTTSRQG